MQDFFRESTNTKKIDIYNTTQVTDYHPSGRQCFAIWCGLLNMYYYQKDKQLSTKTTQKLKIAQYELH
jgi:hypothetical protein